MNHRVNKWINSHKDVSSTHPGYSRNWRKTTFTKFGGGGVIANTTIISRWWVIWCILLILIGANPSSGLLVCVRDDMMYCWFMSFFSPVTWQDSARNARTALQIYGFSCFCWWIQLFHHSCHNEHGSVVLHLLACVYFNKYCNNCS